MDTDTTNDNPRKSEASPAKVWAGEGPELRRCRGEGNGVWLGSRQGRALLHRWYLRLSYR